MVATEQVREIFADSRVLYADALEMLEQDRIRNAAEKAWGATKRATDALILARTGELPPNTAATTQGLLTLSGQSDDYKPLVGQYFIGIGHLHGSCFYNSNCDPIDQTVRRIRETLDYISDAETLAGA